MKVLMFGDVYGDSGVKAVGEFIKQNRDALDVDIVIANAENAASRGIGLNKAAAAALLTSGVDVITLGNHTWRDRDAVQLLSEQEYIIRPANYPDGAPGAGAAVFHTNYGDVGVVNLLGRLYMEACDCPFAAAEREIAKLRDRTNMIVVDIHAEATSEKSAVAYCVDGRCSLVAGTHTHVQTADEHIMANGTAFITDIGMTGPADGVIGVRRDAAIKRFRTLMPERYIPAEGRYQINAVLAEVDGDSGRSTAVRRINIIGEGA